MAWPSSSICRKTVSHEGREADERDLVWSAQENESGVVQSPNKTSTVRSRENLAISSFLPSLVKHSEGPLHVCPDDTSNTLAENVTRRKSKGWTEEVARRSIGRESTPNQLDRRWKDDFIKLG
jgi:hypothetical protein